MRRRPQTPLQRRVFGRLGLFTCIAVALTLAPACSSDDGSGGGGADAGSSSGGSSSGGTAGPTLTAKHPGPCTTTYVTSKGKEHPNYVTRKYDNDKRLVEEKTADFAEGLDATSWTHTWKYGQKGQLLGEEYETSDIDVPNYKWDYERDSKGRKTKAKGYRSGWTRATCTFEYFAKDEQLSGRICLWEVDNFDDEGNLTSTDKGKHIIAYSYGPTQRSEEWSEDGASVPDKVVTKSLDKAGRVTKEETQWELRGYSEHTVTHEYDANGNRTKTVVDSDVDGKPNEIRTWSWDKHGNQLGATFDDDGDGKPNWSWKHTYECWEK